MEISEKIIHLEGENHTLRLLNDHLNNRELVTDHQLLDAFVRQFYNQERLRNGNLLSGCYSCGGERTVVVDIISNNTSCTKCRDVGDLIEWFREKKHESKPK